MGIAGAKGGLLSDGAFPGIPNYRWVDINGNNAELLTNCSISAVPQVGIYQRSEPRRTSGFGIRTNSGKFDSERSHL